MDSKSQRDDDFALNPIILEVGDIKDIESSKSVGSYTRVLINSEEIGYLTPEKYRVMADRAKLSDKLARWALRQLALVWNNKEVFTRNGFISVYIPYGFFSGKDFENEIKALAESGFQLSRLVVELSSDVLYENETAVAGYMEKYRSVYQIKYLLSDYGNEFCPALRLGEFNFEYVMTDSTVCNREDILSQRMKNALIIAKQNGAAVILGHRGRGLIPVARESGFDFYISKSKAVPDGRSL